MSYRKYILAILYGIVIGSFFGLWLGLGLFIGIIIGISTSILTIYSENIKQKRNNYTKYDLLPMYNFFSHS